MDKYIGFDVDDKKIVTHVVSFGQEGKYETIVMDLLVIQEWLVAQRSPGDKLFLTFEVSGFSGWMYDNLLEFVDELVICNPTEMTWIYRTRKKSDRIDAFKMSHLYMMGMLPKVHMPPLEVRQWRLLVQHRRKLVASQTKLKNQIRVMIKNHGFRQPAIKGSWWTLGNLAWMHSLAEKAIELWHLNLGDLLAQLGLLQSQVRKATERLDFRLKSHPGYGLLNTIKGVGPRTIEAILAYADDINRFENGKTFASYFGITPKLDQSGTMRRNGHISKQGPSVVRWLIVECCWQVVRCCPEMRAFYERVQHGQRSRKKIAIVATARKLLMIMHAMLKTGEVFNRELISQQVQPINKAG